MAQKGPTKAVVSGMKSRDPMQAYKSPATSPKGVAAPPGSKRPSPAGTPRMYEAPALKAVRAGKTKAAKTPRGNPNT